MPLNTSATGGYLAPSVDTPPTEDLELDRQIQAMVVGITGLDGTLVRPRWQANPPPMPEPDVNWCAIGVTRIADQDTRPAILHHPENQGTDELQRHETLEILASFYGPNGSRLAHRFRDGVCIPQNREVMRSEGMALLDTGPVITAPDLMNNQWVRRFDLTLRLRRQVSRTYPVLNILEAVGEIRSDTPKDDPPVEPWTTANVTP